MVEGTDYVLFDLQEKGSPVEPIYPAEGTPIIPIPCGVLAKAPNPNAAPLVRNFLFTRKVQQMLVDVGNTRTFHPEAVEKAGRKKMSEIKLLRADPAEPLAALEEIWMKYRATFGV